MYPLTKTANNVKVDIQNMIRLRGYGRIVGCCSTRHLTSNRKKLCLAGVIGHIILPGVFKAVADVVGSSAGR